jgi:hypothetical protein
MQQRVIKQEVLFLTLLSFCTFAKANLCNSGPNPGSLAKERVVL